MAVDERIGIEFDQHTCRFGFSEEQQVQWGVNPWYRVDEAPELYAQLQERLQATLERVQLFTVTGDVHFLQGLNDCVTLEAVQRRIAPFAGLVICFEAETIARDAADAAAS